ncbi:MAG: exodeoxyribonuclease VII large subunit [Methylobacterium sp.]|nr:exodeoxyribonuclease VII large subunit [Methylobacterium sp.]MCA3651296.1 exodeoxyribonuclease VII large subunit [Methylobacterium sp.]MCA4921477.1 exodeoxyribonuclease VII large subunit [Methylobacterium sp.]
MNDLLTNAPEYSVSDLAGALKRTIEDAFGQVRLRGEISGYRGPHSSGHVYFSIKDQNARIDAVIWKGVFGKLKFRPEEGLEVIATGRITTFPGKSTYQIVVEAIEPAGVGALMALLEERRRKLAAEGLFEAARKQLLPFLPRVIGIVTSPTGAVIRDMIHRLTDRFPRKVILWPVRVQGDGSAEEVAAAIRGFNEIEPGGRIPRPDVLIVARGGGSLEDLWSFNEEIVVRAAAMSEIPLVSAIGHETDWTLLDQVADVRAPTPTAAAEMVVPVRADLLHAVRDRGSRLTGQVLRLRDRARRDLAGLLRALPDAQRLIETPRQRLDLAILKRDRARETMAGKRQLALATLTRRLSAQKPEARLARQRERLDGLKRRLPEVLARQQLRLKEQRVQLSERLARAFASRIGQSRKEAAQGKSRLETLAIRLQRAPEMALRPKREKLSKAGQLLGALSYHNVLARGFAVVFDEAGKAVPSRARAAQASRLTLEFADGRLDTVPAEGTEAPRPAPRPTKPTTKPGEGEQGSLF